MTPRLYLFDDQKAREWAPFNLTRPAGELLFGAMLLRERAERYWRTPCFGHLSAEPLTGFSEGDSPPVLGGQELPADGPLILQLSRAALSGPPPDLPPGPATLTFKGEVVAWSLPTGHPFPSQGEILHPRLLPGGEIVPVAGRLLDAPWDLMTQSGDQVREDVPRFFPGYAAEDVPGCSLLGEGLLSLGSNVEIEPGSVFDLRGGPIRLSDGVVVRSHTRLSGPAFVGRDSVILGGALAEVTVGPVCKVRGEVESSVILGYANKAHDGFLGHAYLGRWVNLGALTTNSDLKNNYGAVRVGSPAGTLDTGLMKVGCFLGDHVKTGIGTLLNTGTVVGAGSNLFGGGMPPTYVPPFSWGAGGDLVEYRLEKFLEVARVVMGRRKVPLDAGTEALLRRAWARARAPESAPG